VLQIRVLCQRNQIFLLVDTPVVEQPLKGEIKVVEDCVRVDVDARRVLLEDTAEDGGFLPGPATAVFEFICVDPIVGVVVDFG
jgi:hypothetical protein